jgi:hypothetical protein
VKLRIIIVIRKDRVKVLTEIMPTGIDRRRVIAVDRLSLRVARKGSPNLQSS